MIRPTVGRVMWYRPGVHLAGLVANPAGLEGAQPLAAIVTYVWNDNMVNLAVFGHDGTVQARTSVPIVQDGSPWTADQSPYAEWMPFQKGQAAKTEALEAKLA